MFIRSIIIMIAVLIGHTLGVEEQVIKENEAIQQNCSVLKERILEVNAFIKGMEEIRAKHKEKVPLATISIQRDNLADLMKLYNQAKSDPNMNVEAELSWLDTPWGAKF